MDIGRGGAAQDQVCNVFAQTVADSWRALPEGELREVRPANQLPGVRDRNLFKTFNRILMPGLCHEPNHFIA